ncbi:hypothetical protein QVD17_19288 [Tagetes erecta]|uniref:Uncharacterized protein n=1 Tax=Tagetes erecta TaxID=13708 RepID=A0AAD8NWT5_TARER|nr:hypothetical protein QVD17_19288 [Tagetes erecta]
MEVGKDKGQHNRMVNKDNIKKLHLLHARSEVAREKLCGSYRTLVFAGTLTSRIKKINVGDMSMQIHRDKFKVAKYVGWVSDNIGFKVKDDGIWVHQIVQHMKNANNLIFKCWLMDKCEHKFEEDDFYLSSTCESPLNSNLEAGNGYLRLHVKTWIMLVVGKRRSDVPFDPGGFIFEAKLKDEFFLDGEYDA